MIEIEVMNGIPTEAGYYFAREEGKTYWQTLVRLTGKAPFLSICHQATTFKNGDEIAVEMKLIWSKQIALTNVKLK